MDIKMNGFTAICQRAGRNIFTGNVRIDLCLNHSIRRARAGASVTFEPGGSYCLAYPSAWANPDRHVRVWVGAK